MPISQYGVECWRYWGQGNKRDRRITHGYVRKWEEGKEQSKRIKREQGNWTPFPLFYQNLIVPPGKTPDANNEIRSYGPEKKNRKQWVVSSGQWHQVGSKFHYQRKHFSNLSDHYIVVIPIIFIFLAHWPIWAHPILNDPKILDLLTAYKNIE